jgi:hypothetical protein
MKIISANITGSLILNNVDVSSITGSQSSINSLNNKTGSYAVTGSNVFIGNQTITGSLTITETITGSISNAISSSYASNSDLLDGRDSLTFAGTGSNVFIGNQNINGSVAITGSLTTTGTITAQTINVQQVTSSIVYSSGSNVFGNSVSNTQSMTGSVGITGSLSVNGVLAGTSATFSGDTTVGASNTSGIFTIGNRSGNNFGLLKFAASNTGTNWIITSNAYVGSSLQFTPSTTSGGDTYTTPAMTLTSGGNVGIGNTNGTVGVLNVTGRIALTTGLFFSTNLTSEDRWAIDGGSSDELRFTRSGVARRMTITSDGNVLIGTTTDAGFKLDVNGTFRASTARFTSENSITVSAGNNVINSIYDGTNGNWITLQNAGSVFYTGLENSAGTSFGATAYAGILYLSGARNFEIFTSGVKRLTIASTGEATFSASVKATTGFNSFTDTIGVANVTWVTIYTIPATQAAEGVYNVYAHYNDDSGGMAFTQILADRTHLREINNSDSTVLIQLSGRNIQVYQSYGVTVNIDWSILIQKLR